MFFKLLTFLSFVYVNTFIIFDLFLFRKFTSFILLIPGTLYISWCLASIYFFLFWLCNVRIYFKIKNIPPPPPTNFFIAFIDMLSKLLLHVVLLFSSFIVWRSLLDHLFDHLNVDLNPIVDNFGHSM